MFIRRTLYVLLWIVFIPVAFFVAATWDWWAGLFEKRTFKTRMLFALLSPLYALCFLIVQVSIWWAELID